MTAAAAAWGVSVVVLGLATQLWIALVALLVGGAVNFVLSTFRNAISQAHTDDVMRGRIQGSLIVVLYGGPHMANLLHGTAAEIYGPRMVICLGGVLTVVTVAAIVRAAPQLRHYTTRHFVEPALPTAGAGADRHRRHEATRSAAAEARRRSGGAA